LLFVAVFLQFAIPIRRVIYVFLHKEDQSLGLVK